VSFPDIKFSRPFPDCDDDLAWAGDLAGRGWREPGSIFAFSQQPIGATPGIAPEGPLQRLQDLTEPPRVGEKYLVPCVQVMGNPAIQRHYEFIAAVNGLPVRDLKPWFPILGPAHDDADLGVPQDHHHLDLRFIRNTEMRLITNYFSELFFRVFTVDVILGGPELRPRPCLRDQPLYPCDRPHAAPGSLTSMLDQVRSQPPWLPDLEAKYEGRCASKGICPHRGAPLLNQPVVGLAGHQVRVCPLHGLAFDVHSGALVRRATW